MKKTNFILCLVMFVLSSSFILADSPLSDVTGDCFVDFEDFAVLADEWLSGGVMPYSALRRDDIAAMEGEMSTSSIDSSKRQ